MLFSSFTTKNNTKDANSFAPSCSSADKNSNIVILAGIAFAVSVFLSLICFDIICIIIALSALIIKASAVKRKKHFVC